MKGAVRWMANNHVAANLLMTVLVVGGIVKGVSVKQEVFPEVSLDRVQVKVAYPGAGPEEVEEGIIRQIEENLTGVDGIKQLKSTAAEGFGSVTAEMRDGEDVDLILQDIKSEVDRIITFPEEAEKPVITKLLNRREVVSVVVYGDATDRTLREQAEAVREELLLFPEITQVDRAGVRPYEISVEITEENPGWFDVTWKVPMRGDMILGIEPVLPSSLEPIGPPSTRLIPGASIQRFTCRSDGAGLAGQEVFIEGLSALQIDVIVRVDLADGTSHSAILRPGSPHFVIPARASRGDVAWSYTRMGVIHILEGIDHLEYVKRWCRVGGKQSPVQRATSQQRGE